jgi:hypothetical protein
VHRRWLSPLVRRSCRFAEESVGAARQLACLPLNVGSRMLCTVEDSLLAAAGAGHGGASGADSSEESKGDSPWAGPLVPPAIDGTALTDGELHAPTPTSGAAAEGVFCCLLVAPDMG